MGRSFKTERRKVSITYKMHTMMSYIFPSFTCDIFRKEVRVRLQQKIIYIIGLLYHQQAKPVMFLFFIRFAF